MRNTFIGILLFVPLVGLAADTPDKFAVTSGLGASGNQLSSIATVQYQAGVHHSTEGASTMDIVQLIFDAENSSPIRDNRVTQGTFSNPWYSNILYGTGSGGRCYRGSISADGISFTGNKVAHNDATSGRVCVYVAPPPPEPGSEDPPNCVVLYGKEVEIGEESSSRSKRTSGDRCDSASPIVIDLKGKEPDLSGPNDPVSFDILRTGTRSRLPGRSETPTRGSS